MIDAKKDWLKIVNKHKKKQKGLPALSTLNTNAGNVEHNIEMFNMMQPDGLVSVDSVNGNVGMGESMETKTEYVTLHYNDLPIEVVTKYGNPGGYYSSSFGNWLPDDDETKEILVDWVYKADRIEVIEFLQDLDEVLIDLGLDLDVDDDILYASLEQNFDQLVEKYDEALKHYFHDRAVSDAQDHYEYQEDFDECYDALETKEVSYKGLDDSFDMSTRTLL